LHIPAGHGNAIGIGRWTDFGFVVVARKLHPSLTFVQHLGNHAKYRGLDAVGFWYVTKMVEDDLAGDAVQYFFMGKDLKAVSLNLNVPSHRHDALHQRI